MGVRGRQADAAQAAGDQGAQEGQPGGAVLGSDDVQAERLAEAVAVDTNRVHYADVDGAAAFAALDHQRVERHVDVRAPSSGRVRKSSTIWSSDFASRETWLLLI